MFTLSRKNILGSLTVLFGGTGVFASISLLLSKIAKLENPAWSLTIYNTCSQDYRKGRESSIKVKRREK